MKKCYTCGAKNVPDTAKYCPYCGKPMEVTAGLVQRAAAGEEAAQTELYYRTYNAVYGRIRAKVPDEDTAIDLVQDTYIRAFTRLNQLREPASFPGWILTIARNQTVDWYRKNARSLGDEPFPPDEYREESYSAQDDARPEYRIDHLPEASMDANETARLMAEILDGLPEGQRMVLILRYYDQLSIREIAQELDVNVNTVKTRLAAGQRKVEAGVKNLERRGTKLYGLAPIPFLLLLLRNAEAQAQPISAEIMLSAAAPASAAVSGTAAGSTSGTAAAAGRAAGTAARTAAKAAAGHAARGLGIKIVAAVAVVLMPVIIVATRKTTIDLNKYIEFTETGYEGYGKIVVSFDYESFESDYADKLEVKGQLDENEDTAFAVALLQGLQYTDSEIALALFEEACIRYSLDQTSGLSNGDVVTLTWDEDISDIAGEYFDCKVKTGEVAYTMETLEEVGSVDLFDGVTVTFSGYDTIGTAEVTYDSSVTDITGIRYTLDSTSELSNGDTVVVTASSSSTIVDLEDYLAGNYGVIPESLTKTYTVEGLDAITTVDVFADVTLEYKGFAPVGTATLSVDTDDEMIKSFSFSMDRTSGLSNGDVITVTAVIHFWYLWDAEGYYLEIYGAIPESLTKEYTVEGLGYYATSLSDISEDAMNEMKAQTEEVIRNQEANRWMDPETLGDVTYIGSYFLSLKDFSNVHSIYNFCCVAYAIDITTSEESFTFYYCLEFDNIVVTDDGTCIVELEHYSPVDDRFIRGGQTYRGSETVDNLFDVCVTSNEGSYNYESTVEP